MARDHGASDDLEEDEADVVDPEEYDELLELERLESLEEEMRELGVTTLDELRERIARLHGEMDEQGE